MLTVAGLGAVIVAGVFFAAGRLALGAGMVLLGGFLDSLDGELARLEGGPSPFGGFLDSICDHCGDFAMYLGLLWLYLQHNALSEIMLIFVALFASVFGSHVRARAGMAGIDTKTVGIFTRAERTLVLVAGLLLDKVVIALWILAIFNSFSALQRVIYTFRLSYKSKQDLGELS
jgi:phosphatidylglycerophosphate synthase